VKDVGSKAVEKARDLKDVGSKAVEKARDLVVGEAEKGQELLREKGKKIEELYANLRSMESAPDKVDAIEQELDVMSQQVLALRLEESLYLGGLRETRTKLTASLPVLREKASEAAATAKRLMHESDEADRLADDLHKDFDARRTKLLETTFSFEEREIEEMESLGAAEMDAFKQNELLDASWKRHQDLNESIASKVREDRDAEANTLQTQNRSAMDNVQNLRKQLDMWRQGITEAEWEIHEFHASASKQQEKEKKEIEASLHIAKFEETLGGVRKQSDEADQQAQSTMDSAIAELEQIPDAGEKLFFDFMRSRLGDWLGTKLSGSTIIADGMNAIIAALSLHGRPLLEAFANELKLMSKDLVQGMNRTLFADANMMSQAMYQPIGKTGSIAGGAEDVKSPRFSEEQFRSSQQSPGHVGASLGTVELHDAWLCELVLQKFDLKIAQIEGIKEREEQQQKQKQAEREAIAEAMRMINTTGTREEKRKKKLFRKKDQTDQKASGAQEGGLGGVGLPVPDDGDMDIEAAAATINDFEEKMAQDSAMIQDLEEKMRQTMAEHSVTVRKDMTKMGGEIIMKENVVDGTAGKPRELEEGKEENGEEGQKETEKEEQSEEGDSKELDPSKMNWLDKLEYENKMKTEKKEKKTKKEKKAKPLNIEHPD
jgi:hypothetical protein